MPGSFTPPVISFTFSPSFSLFRRNSWWWDKCNSNNNKKKKNSLKWTYPLIMQNTLTSFCCCCSLLVLIEYHTVYTQHGHKSHWKPPLTPFNWLFFFLFLQRKRKERFQMKSISVPDYLILSQVKSKKRWQADKWMARKKITTVPCNKDFEQSKYIVCFYVKDIPSFTHPKKTTQRNRSLHKVQSSREQIAKLHW